jgi:hypothetical protein
LTKPDRLSRTRQDSGETEASWKKAAVFSSLSSRTGLVVPEVLAHQTLERRQPLPQQRRVFGLVQ